MNVTVIDVEVLQFYNCTLKTYTFKVTENNLMIICRCWNTLPSHPNEVLHS